MAKIARSQHKVFGAGGSSDNFAQVGSLVAGSPLKTKDIATIQALPAWDQGLQLSIYGDNKDLLLQDINSILFEHSEQVAYIFQSGTPEWQAATEYSKGSVVQRTTGGGDATGEEYVSLIDANTGNALPVQASNANWRWNNPPVYVPGASATLTSIPKVANAAATVGPPGSVTFTDSLLSDDGTNVVIGGAVGVNGLKFPDNTVQRTAAINTAVAAQAVVTGARALNTVFQNVGSKPLFVSVSLGLNGASAQVMTDASLIPTTAVLSVSGSSSAPPGIPVFFIVLPGNYYRIVTSGAVAANIWTEWQ